MELQIMAATQTSSFVPRAFHSVPFVELRQSLPNHIAVISPFVDQLMRFIARFRNPDGSEAGIEIALREALANAVRHGNREDLTKRVDVTCRCYSDGELLVTVSDEGEGFVSNSIPDPTNPGNRLACNGRGIYLIQAYMDEVWFENGGTLVRMRKNSNAESEAQKRF
jgi:serine/threonine-protein kinase RsbW